MNLHVDNPSANADHAARMFVIRAPKSPFAVARRLALTQARWTRVYTGDSLS
jgi:hypothetical protein